MRRKGIIITVAVFFGLAAAFAVTSYANRARNQALDLAKAGRVVTAVEPLPVGMTVQEMRDRKLLAVKKIPKEFVADDALAPGSDLGRKVLAVSLGAGEQLTAAKFKVSKEAGLSFTIPEDMVAVAIPIDDMKAAGNLIKVGDYVNVVGTAKTVDDQELTKTILQTVQVLAVGKSLENEDKSKRSTVSGLGARADAQQTGRTVTLALRQADAEKLIFMQDQGRIWLTLLPSKKAQPVSTGGQTIETVFEGATNSD